MIPAWRGVKRRLSMMINTLNTIDERAHFNDLSLLQILSLQNDCETLIEAANHALCELKNLKECKAIYQIKEL